MHRLPGTARIEGGVGKKIANAEGPLVLKLPYSDDYRVIGA
jgi:hypothetical protein